MFHFFHTIFSGVTSLLAGAIIAVGLVAMPTTEIKIAQNPPSPQNEEILTIQETETQKSATVPAPVKPSIPKISETKPTPTPTPTPPLPTSTSTPTPASTPTLTLNTTSTSNTNKGEWVLDMRPGSSDYGKQFWVPEWQTLDQVRPIATSTVATEALKITSVNVSSTNQVMTFDWTTNKPATGKVFLTGNNYSQSSNSGSGLSTRHIVNFYSLNADSEYSYEIESVAGEEVIKKQGPLSTKLDIHLFKVVSARMSDDVVKEDGTFIGYYGVVLKYQTGKDTNSIKTPKDVPVNLYIPSLNINQTKITTLGCCGPEDIFATFRIPVTKDGTYSATFSANGATYNYNLVINAINATKDALCRDFGVFCDSKDFAYADMTPRIVKTLDNAKIQSRLSGLDHEIIAKFKFVGIIGTDLAIHITSSIPLEFYIWQNPIGYIARSGTILTQSGTIEGVFTTSIALPSKNEIEIRNAQVLNPGTYTLAITSIDAHGKVFNDLPMTFTFTVEK